jgi:TRAP-type mannitol/chloroaromatic compound transport system permease small subunit
MPERFSKQRSQNLEKRIIMEGFKKFLSFLDAISTAVGKTVAWLIVFITLIVVFEVVTRRFFGAPTIWTFESSIQMYAAHFMLSAAYALLHRTHVSIDVIYQYFSERKKALLDVISYIVLFFPFCSVLLWQGTKFAATSWQMKETSWSVFAPPLYPIKTVIPITAALLLLQGFAVFSRRFYFLVKGEEL